MECLRLVRDLYILRDYQKLNFEGSKVKLYGIKTEGIPLGTTAYSTYKVEELLIEVANRIISGEIK